MKLLENIAIPTEHIERGWIRIDGARIAGSGAGDAPDAQEGADPSVERIDGGGMSALPGFIDVHVHGSNTADTMDATPDAIRTMAQFYAAHGVTAFLATTMTHSDEATTAALINAANLASNNRGAIQNGATLLGVHLEGPYINEKAKGAQSGEFVRRANPDEYRRWFDIGVIRQVTVAPEFSDNQQFISECVKRGIVVSLGHTTASYEQAGFAFSMGARQVTHMFNAMTGLHHRNPGMVGAAMITDEVKCELICDAIHVHPAAMRIVVKVKGTGGVIAITDAIRAAGIAEGESELGGQRVVVRNGTATLEDGTLAGSVLTMDAGLRRLMGATGLSLAEIAPIFSTNAANQLGVNKGVLREGFDADVVLLDNRYHVGLTIALGEVVYARQQL